MKIVKLKNGLTLVVEKRKSDSVAIQATVKTGSNNETSANNGISHFIEHMLFEGTTKRGSAKIISNEIESLGGEVNAYTSNERTCFFIKVPKKHFVKALDILSDIIQNPLFDKKDIEKERKVIIKEINQHKDEPRFHQWVLFQQTLFKKLPVRNPTAGTVASVRKLKRKDIINYYKKYYVPNNIIISIAGDVKKVDLDYFRNFKAGGVVKLKKVKEPKQVKVVKKEKKKILNSYMVLGYKTCSRLSKDSYVLDVLKAILGKGQSGRIYDEIRNKRGLAYEVGIHHEPAASYGFFSVYLNTDKKNIPKAISIILNEFKLKNLSLKELNEAKSHLEGQFILSNEYGHERADELGFWACIKDAKLYDSYLKEIRKVSLKDVLRVASKYLTENYVMTVIEQN